MLLDHIIVDATYNSILYQLNRYVYVEEVRNNFKVMQYAVNESFKVESLHDSQFW